MKNLQHTFSSILLDSTIPRNIHRKIIRWPGWSSIFTDIEATPYHVFARFTTRSNDSLGRGTAYSSTIRAVLAEMSVKTQLRINHDLEYWLSPYGDL